MKASPRIALALVIASAIAADQSEARTRRRRPKPKPPETLSDALTGEAKEEYERAGMIFRSGDNAGALRRYQRAYELQPDPRLLWNMAVCEKQLRHYAKVLPLVGEFLAKAAPMIGPEEKKTANEFEQAVRALVGEITIACAEPDTRVLIDEEQIDSACTRPIVLDGGDHRLRATKNGFKEQQVTINVPNGGARTVSLALEPEPKEGRLTVRAEPGDSIAIDGQSLGQGSWSGALPAGLHSLVVSAPEKKERHTEIELKDRDDKSVQIVLEPDSSGLPVWAIVAGAIVLAAGAAVGGYFLFRPGTQDPIQGTLGTHALP
jgi:PEGA domain-containing protein